MAKYELTDETKVMYGVTLHRIRALTSIGLTVAAGQLGGWVQSEANLNQSGNAWVSGNAQVKKSRHYVVIGPVGSEDRTVTICRTKTEDVVGHQISAGCWTGTVDQLVERLPNAWPNVTAKKRARLLSDYQQVITLARLRIAEWQK